MSKVLARSVREKFDFNSVQPPSAVQRKTNPPLQREQVFVERHPYYLSVCQLMEAGGGGVWLGGQVSTCESLHQKEGMGH
jgi:hypothetical protein